MRNERVIVTDDLSGEEGADSVFFAIGNNEYTIDLAAENLEALYEALAPFIEAATPVRPTRPKQKTWKLDTTRPDPLLVRKWAKSRGVEVGLRGRIPADVIAAYEQDLHS